MSTYVEPSTPGFGYYGTEAATIRIEPSGKVNVYIAGGSTGNSLETTVVQLDRRRARRRHRRRRTRSRATPRSPASAPAPAGSRSGSMTAGAVARDRGDPARAHRRHRRAPARGGRPTTSSWPTAGRACAARRRSASRSPRSPRSRTSSRTRCRRACPPGSRRAPATPPPRASIWVNATHVCTCEVDVDDRAGRAAALHRERGLRPDDQPRTSSRARSPAASCRASAACCSSTSPTTTTATRSPPRSWTTCCRPRPRCRSIEYGHIETPSPGPGGYKGVGEGGAIGAPPAVVNAVADALAPVRRDDHPPAAHVPDRRAPRRGRCTERRRRDR